MIVIIITNYYLLNLAELAHLAPKVLIERIKVVLQLARIHLDLRIISWVLVEVGKQDRLAVGGLDVLARAAVSMSASPNFVVEGTVYFVGFCAED